GTKAKASSPDAGLTPEMPTIPPGPRTPRAPPSYDDGLTPEMPTIPPLRNAAPASADADLLPTIPPRRGTGRAGADSRKKATAAQDGFEGFESDSPLATPSFS